MIQTFERIDGETPHGGAYHIAYFYDIDNNPCERKDAVRVNIVEYDKDDNRICETYLSK